ncbi:MAG: hypothetical protein COC05_02465 [Gammaproteobacteria bacterium]|nr:MAG: hypothetical protein COC05_02465 [Gammaproteobacteria bacterium]
MNKHTARQGKKGLMAGVLSACIALTACGGGGGGSATNTAPTSPGDNPDAPPLLTPPVTQGLTEENYIQVAAFSFLGGLFFDFEQNPQSVNSAGPDAAFFLVALAADCESGSADFGVNMPGGIVSMVGDSFSLDHSDCVMTFPDDGSQERTNGRFSGEITRRTGSAGAPFTATLLLNNSNNFTIEALTGEDAGFITTIEGQLQIDTEGDTVTDTSMITSADYTVTTTSAAGERLIFESPVSAINRRDMSNNTFTTEVDYTLSLLSAITDGTFVVDTTTPFLGIGGMVALDAEGDVIPQPISGALTITDSNGAVVTLTAMTDGVSAEISLDLDGDTVADVSQIITYEVLDAVLEAF